MAAGVPVNPADSVAGVRLPRFEDRPDAHPKCQSNQSGRAERTGSPGHPPSRLAHLILRNRGEAGELSKCVALNPSIRRFGN